MAGWGRCSAFQVLECCPLEQAVIGVQGTEGYADSVGGQQQSPMHIAFIADTRDQVRAFHAAALAAGGTDNGPPGLREIYHPNYFGAFALDPDGNNVEAVCHRPEP